MKLLNNKILITGGATGIGLGLTERFLIENNIVIVCGRREAVLKDLSDKHPSVITRTCDLSKAGEREKLFAWISEEHADLNVLVNNAGIQQWMSVSDHDFFWRAKAELETNIEAPLHLTSLFVNLKALTTVINVTSALAYVPFVKVPVYSATKAFLHSFTLSLRHSLAARGIEVIALIPPALNTDLGGEGRHDFASPVSDFIESVFVQLKEQRTDITFGFSEVIVNAGPEDLRKAFDRMNGSDRI